MLLPTLLFALTNLQVPAAASTPEKSEAKTGLERVVVVGASLSDGVGLAEKTEVGARTTLADVVDAAVLVEHKAPASLASSWMFMNTTADGIQQIAGARDKNPTLLVAIDFLFWYGYGTRAETSRLGFLEKGLKELDTFACPVVVGDFPDMTQALEGRSTITGGPLIVRDQIPQPETLKLLNERLAAWAAERPNVVVVPIAELTAKLRANEEISVRGNKWTAGSFGTLYQADRLHPTLRGAIAVWIHAADKLVTAHPEIAASSLEWDAETIRRKVYAAKEKDRLAQAERDRKRREKATTPPEPPPQPAEEAAKARKARGGGGAGERGGEEPRAFDPSALERLVDDGR